MAPEPAAGFFCQRSNPRPGRDQALPRWSRVREPKPCLRITLSVSSPSGKPNGSGTRRSARSTSIPSRPKLYILDMFPYPSGAGLHVGHPEGYTATDIVCRYKRMRGFNVLHPMGWDAFGLPAEQYAVQTNTHPRITTQANIDTFRRQIKSLGFSLRLGPRGRYHRPRLLQVDAVDLPEDLRHLVRPDFEWTIGRAEPRKGKGRPIAELPIPPGTDDPDAYRDARRLAYRAEVAGQLVPRAGHRAGQRGSDRRQERARRLSGRPHAADASGCCGSRPMPSG